MSTKSVNIDVEITAETSQATDAVAAIAQIETAATAANTKSNGLLADTGKAGQALSVITAASTGNINGMARALAGLSSTLSLLMMYAGAFFTGFKAGTKAIDWVWTNFINNIKGGGPVITKTREQFDELNKVKLDTLAKEVQGIQRETNDLLAAIDKAVSRAAALRDAEAAAEKARILAEEPAGPARDLKIAALDKGTSETAIAAREDAARKKLEELAKSEAAIRERIASAEAADQALQEKAAKAKARVNKERAGGRYNSAFIKAAVQANLEAQSSAASLPQLREQLDPELAGIAESRADAQNQLAIAAAQRSTAGSQFSAARQDIGRRVSRQQLQEQLAAQQAEAARIKAQTEAQMGPLSSRVAMEQADVSAIDRQISDFTGSTRFSPRSSSYQSTIRDLEAQRQKEQQEAETAIAIAQNTAQALGNALRSVTQQIQNIQSTIANLEN